MDRRQFLTWIGVSAVASSLPMAIAACTPQSEPEATVSADPGSSSGATAGEFQPVGTVSQLDQDGQLLIKEGVAAPVLVIRNPQDADALIAVNPTCPHAGCDVVWQASQTIFVCPCHNSRFAADGSVTRGPAAMPLAVYEAEIRNEQVFVKES